MGKDAKDEFYIVEEILDHKKVRGQFVYHVQWQGYTQTTWEPKQNLENIQGMLKAYHDRYEASQKNDTEGKVGKKKRVKKDKSNEDSATTATTTTSKTSPKHKQVAKNDANSKQAVKTSDNDSNDTKSITSSTLGQGSRKTDESIIIKEEDDSHLDSKKQQSQESIAVVAAAAAVQAAALEALEAQKQAAAVAASAAAAAAAAAAKEAKQINKEGNLENNIPIDIFKAVSFQNEIFYYVNWKQNVEGLNIVQSKVSSIALQKRYSDLIISFYETKSLQKK